MNIRTDDFRVREGDEVNLSKLPTVTDPIYGSAEDYQDLLAKHVIQLSHDHTASVMMAKTTGLMAWAMVACFVFRVLI